MLGFAINNIHFTPSCITTKAISKHEINSSLQLNGKLLCSVTSISSRTKYKYY